MDRKKLITVINSEIQSLQKVVSILSASTDEREVKTTVKGTGLSRTFVMNPAARKRISDAQKARWNKVREDKVREEREATAKFKEGSSKAKPKPKTNKKSPTSS